MIHFDYSNIFPNGLKPTRSTIYASGWNTSQLIQRTNLLRLTAQGISHILQPFLHPWDWYMKTYMNAWYLKWVETNQLENLVTFATRSATISADQPPASAGLGDVAFGDAQARVGDEVEILGGYGPGNVITLII